MFFPSLPLRGPGRSRLDETGGTGQCDVQPANFLWQLHISE